ALFSIHVILSERTRGLVGDSELRLMKPSAWLVNISRGPSVDDAALIPGRKESPVPPSTYLNKSRCHKSTLSGSWRTFWQPHISHTRPSRFWRPSTKIQFRTLTLGLGVRINELFSVHDLELCAIISNLWCKSIAVCKISSRPMAVPLFWRRSSMALL
ncbi:MAG: NAD(P)-dependent oxidoreductase, partial [Candidatus Nitrosopolaris sp.]